jgi:transcriptional regulator of NAD metabolism
MIATAIKTSIKVKPPEEKTRLMKTLSDQEGKTLKQGASRRGTKNAQ